MVLLLSCSNKKETAASKEALHSKSYDQKIDDLLDVMHNHNKFMGSVSLSKEGNIIYTRSIGFENFDTQKPSTKASKYRVGSITKMFTSALIFIAIEENKLSLHQSIDSYFPSITNSDKITIAHLLNHRSGIPSFTKDKLFFEYRTEYKSRKEMLKMITGYKSNFEPNSKNEYSNSNYFLLSLVLEKIYDLTYESLLTEKIIKPLKLKNTYSGGKINKNSNEAYSYSFKDEWIKFPETDLSIALGSGSVISNPNDLNLFIEGLFNEKLISKETLKAMTTIKDNMGLGIFPYSHKENKGFGHGGHIDAFHSISIYFPQEKLAVAISSNAIDYNINNLLTDVLKCYFNEPFELPNFEEVEISANQLEQYVGVYSGKGPGKFKITKKDNTLYSQLNDGPNDPLVYKGNHVFTNPEVGASFIFNPEKNQLGLEQSGVADIYIFYKEPL